MTLSGLLVSAGSRSTLFKGQQGLLRAYLPPGTSIRSPYPGPPLGCYFPNYKDIDMLNDLVILGMSTANLLHFSIT